MNARTEKVKRLQAISQGKPDPAKEKLDLSKLTDEQLLKVQKIQRSLSDVGCISTEDREYWAQLTEKCETLPPYFGWHPKIKKWLVEGKTLKEIAGSMHIPWQDTKPVQKVIDYMQENGIL